MQRRLLAACSADGPSLSVHGHNPQGVRRSDPVRVDRGIQERVDPEPAVRCTQRGSIQQAAPVFVPECPAVPVSVVRGLAWRLVRPACLRHPVQETVRHVRISNAAVQITATRSPKKAR